MIKKEIKPFDFIEKEETHFMGFISPGVYTIEHDITIVNTATLNQPYPNEWSVQLGGQRVLQMGDDGNLNITGQIQALGTVIWDSQTNRFKFWDGIMWQTINFTLD
jgi:hypothetical protein